MLEHRGGQLILFDGRPEHFLVTPTGEISLIDVAEVRAGDGLMDLAVLGLHEPLCLPGVLEAYGPFSDFGPFVRPGPYYLLVWIADGKSLVRALRAGAEGGWIGTRFAASAESYAHSGYKARLVNAKGQHATTFTTTFGPEFPNATQRVLANRAVTAPPSTEPPVIGSTLLFPGVFNVPYDMPKYSAIVPTRDTTGDLEEMDLPAGSESVLEIVQVQPAAEIVHEIVTEAKRLLAGGDRDDD